MSGLLTTGDDDTLILLVEAISLGRRDGMASQHLGAMCSARDDLRRYRTALQEIATGRNAAGEKVDFPQEIAREALADE